MSADEATGAPGQQPPVVMVDPQHGTSALVAALGGQIIDLSARSGPLNPLDLP